MSVRRSVGLQISSICIILGSFSGDSRSDDNTQKLTSNGSTTTGGNVADVSGNLGLIPSSGVTANGGFRAQTGALSSAAARSGRGIQTHADGKVRDIYLLRAPFIFASLRAHMVGIGAAHLSKK